MLSSLLKINKLSALVAVLLFAQVMPAANSADFQAVYKSALSNSTELKLVNSTLAESDAELSTTNAAFLPKLGVEARYEKFKSDTQEVKGDTSNVYAEWNLFNGFKDIKKRKSLKAQYEISRISRDRFELNFEWVTKAKYAQAHALQEKVETYKKVIQANLKYLETVKRQRSSGRLSESDYLEFQLFDAKLKQDLLQTEVLAANALSELKAFAGLAELTQLSTQLEPKALKLDQKEIKQLLASDKSQLTEAKHKVDSLEAQKEEATGNFLPEVNLKASYGSQGLREAVEDPETAVAVTAKWELFSGFENINTRKKAAVKLNQAQLQFENDKIHSLSHAEQLASELKNIVERTKFETDNQKNVDRFLNTVEGEYRRGVKNSSDLKSALELILETSLNRSDLRASYFASRAELQEILGQVLQEQ